MGGALLETVMFMFDSVFPCVSSLPFFLQQSVLRPVITKITTVMPMAIVAHVVGLSHEVAQVWLFSFESRVACIADTCRNERMSSFV